jgi:selenoprotein W-related protein
MSTSVEIEYCLPCGHLEQAINTRRAILQQFGRRLDGVGLKTGHGGVFTIRVDSEQIYDKTQGYDLAGILQEINTRL